MKHGRNALYSTFRRTYFSLMMSVLVTLGVLFLYADAAGPQPDNNSTLPPHTSAEDRAPVAIPEPATLAMFLSVLSIFLYKGIRQKVFPERHPENPAEPSGQKQRLAHEHIIGSGHLTAEVAHDVRNLLTGIRTCAEVLQYPDISPRDHREFTTIILNNIDQAVEMLQGLLDAAKGAAAGLHLKPVAVQALLHDILCTLEPDFTRHKIEVRAELPGDLNCLIDPAQMKRAFTNILLNARDAMPAGGTLTISAQIVNDCVEILIADTGCGMSPELQARIFEPFVTHGKSYGTGLGMTIVKSILDAHRASMALQSREGYGTTIRITFPR